MAMKTKTSNPGAGVVSSFGAAPNHKLSLPSPLGGDFHRVQSPKRQAMVLLIGDDKTGKSTFVTNYCPGPIAYFSFDGRSNHAIDKATRELGKVIECADYLIPSVAGMDVAQAKKAGQAVLDRFMRSFEIAVRAGERGNIRTIAFDTGTELDSIINLSVTGGEDQGKNTDFGASIKIASRIWWRIFNLAREGPAHLVVLGRMTEIFQGREGTGEYKFSGSKVVGQAVDWSAQQKVKKTKIPAGLGKTNYKLEFEMKVLTAGVNVEELGKTYTEKDWEGLGGPFVYGSLMQYEGSNISDWE